MSITPVDDFLAKLPPDQRAALERLRAQIRQAAPGAVETIGYGVPAFKLDGRPLVSFGAAKSHCSFYVQSPKVIEAHADALAAFKLTKGSVTFDPGRPIGAELVARLVRARVAEGRGTR